MGKTQLFTILLSRLFSNFIFGSLLTGRSINPLHFVSLIVLIVATRRSCPNSTDFVASFINCLDICKCLDDVTLLDS